MDQISSGCARVPKVCPKLDAPHTHHSWRKADEYASMKEASVVGVERSAVSVTVVPSLLSCALTVCKTTCQHESSEIETRQSLQ